MTTNTTAPAVLEGTLMPRVTAATVDRLIAGIAKRSAGLLQLADRAAIAIIQNPADLAGRAITLLEAMNGIKSQKNLINFFDDFLQNEIVERKNGGFILGKKRQDWLEPSLPETGLTPTTYVNMEKAAMAKADRVAKAAATKKAKAADAEKAAESHNKRESDLVTRERELESRIDNIRAISAEKVRVAEADTLAVQKELKAESDRLRMVLSEKAKLENELTAAKNRIAELETELTAMRKALADTVAPTVTAVAAKPATATKPARRKRA